MRGAPRAARDVPARCHPGGRAGRGRQRWRSAARAERRDGRRAPAVRGPRDDPAAGAGVRDDGHRGAVPAPGRRPRGAGLRGGPVGRRRRSGRVRRRAGVAPPRRSRRAVSCWTAPRPEVPPRRAYRPRPCHPRTYRNAGSTSSRNRSMSVVSNKPAKRQLDHLEAELLELADPVDQRRGVAGERRTLALGRGACPGTCLRGRPGEIDRHRCRLPDVAGSRPTAAQWSASTASFRRSTSGRSPYDSHQSACSATTRRRYFSPPPATRMGIRGSGPARTTPHRAGTTHRRTSRAGRTTAS